MGLKCLCLMVKDIHDSHGTVSNIFGPYLRDLLLKIWEIYKKNALTLSVFEQEKCFFRSKFCQKSIGTIIRGLVQNPRELSAIKNLSKLIDGEGRVPPHPTPYWAVQWPDPGKGYDWGYPKTRRCSIADYSPKMWPILLDPFDVVVMSQL